MKKHRYSSEFKWVKLANHPAHPNWKEVQGIAPSENRVARLMRAAGLEGRVVRVTRRAPGVHRFFEATDNLRMATAPPTGINQQWVGDVTYLKAYIRFYNHHRLHSSIDYNTPEEYERLVA